MSLTDGDVDRLRAAAGPGTDVFADQFTIVRLAGEGGMGQVFEAIERVSGKRVAIKVLSDSDVARFAAEAEILERLEHPAIVSYVSHGITTEGRPYLAMAWLDGESLSDRLARGRLELAGAIAIAQRIADALVYAHGQGVVHRDIKPSNVLLVDGDPAKAVLVDLGIAKDAEAQKKLTHTGQLIGTPGYMAPEQALGRADVDGRADLFALGCMLHEAISGEVAFGGAEVMEVLARLLLDAPTPLDRIRDDIPHRIAVLVTSLLAKEPQHRLADAKLAAAELVAIGAALEANDKKALARSPIEPHVEERTTVDERRALARPAPRRRVPWWPFAAGAAALGIGAVGLVMVMRDDGPAEPEHPCTIHNTEACKQHCELGRGDACWIWGRDVYRDASKNGGGGAAGIDILKHGCELESAMSCNQTAFAMKAQRRRGNPAYSPADIDQYLTRSCTLGYNLACQNLAEALVTGDALPQDEVRGLAMYEKACALGAATSCVEAAKRIARGAGTTADRSRAQALLDDACKRNIPKTCAAKLE